MSAYFDFSQHPDLEMLLTRLLESRIAYDNSLRPGPLKRRKIEAYAPRERFHRDLMAVRALSVNPNSLAFGTANYIRVWTAERIQKELTLAWPKISIAYLNKI